MMKMYIDGINAWYSKAHGIREPFIGFHQIYSDKTLKLPRSAGLVPYTVHTIFLNVTVTMRQLRIGYGHTLVEFLPVRCSDELLEGERGGVEMSVY